MTESSHTVFKPTAEFDALVEKLKIALKKTDTTDSFNKLVFNLYHTPGIAPHELMAVERAIYDIAIISLKNLEADRAFAALQQLSPQSNRPMIHTVPLASLFLKDGHPEKAEAVIAWNNKCDEDCDGCWQKPIGHDKAVNGFSNEIDKWVQKNHTADFTMILDGFKANDISKAAVNPVDSKAFHVVSYTPPGWKD